MDRYVNFASLAAHETGNTDYRIRIRDLKSPVSIIAPHAGRIEPCTGDIARMIAGEIYNWYAFEGLKPRGNRALHITSHRFDEPAALSLCRASDIVVTVHACTDRTDIVYVGGLFSALAHDIEKQLIKNGIKAAPHDRYRGRHPENICNRSRTGRGVQLEISRSIRDAPDRSAVAAAAVRTALHDFLHRSCP